MYQATAHYQNVLKKYSTTSFDQSFHLQFISENAELRKQVNTQATSYNVWAFGDASTIHVLLINVRASARNIS